MAINILPNDVTKRAVDQCKKYLGQTTVPGGSEERMGFLREALGRILPDDIKDEIRLYSDGVPPQDFLMRDPGFMLAMSPHIYR